LNTDTALAIAATSSAVASVVSALIAYRAVNLSNRPSVWAVASPRNDDGDRYIGVQIHNAGPGVAFDVAAARTEPTDRLVGRVRRSMEWREQDQSPFIRTMERGERVPASDKEWLSVGPNRSGDDVLGVLIRYTDAVGRRWQVPVQLNPMEKLPRARRLFRPTW
jgi:hypothetical protein